MLLIDGHQDLYSNCCKSLKSIVDYYKSGCWLVEGNLENTMTISQRGAMTKMFKFSCCHSLIVLSVRHSLFSALVLEEGSLSGSPTVGHS